VTRQSAALDEAAAKGGCSTRCRRFSPESTCRSFIFVAPRVYVAASLAAHKPHDQAVSLWPPVPVVSGQVAVEAVTYILRRLAFAAFLVVCRFRQPRSCYAAGPMADGHETLGLGPRSERDRRATRRKRLGLNKSTWRPSTSDWLFGAVRIGLRAVISLRTPGR